MSRLLVLACLLSLAVAACGGSPAASTIEVSLGEWSIGVSTDSYLEGPITIQIQNDGEFAHTLVAEGPGGAVLAATAVIAPGDQATFELNLSAVDYRFTCRIVTSLEDGTVVDHFAQGMARTISPAASD